MRKKRLIQYAHSKWITVQINLFILEKFPKRSWLRAGVYFVESLPKTNNGKLVPREITKMASEMFEELKQKDTDIQLYLADIPLEFRKLI